MSISNEQSNNTSEVDLDSLAWERGSLNDSSFRALCKLAARAIDPLALREVLEEITARIHAAGDHAQTRKLIDQTRDAFSFVARKRASEILFGHESSEARPQTSKWPQAEPALIEEIGAKFTASTLARLAASSPSGASEASEVLPLLFSAQSFVCSTPEKYKHYIYTLEETCPRAIWAQYIVPNPAAGPARFIERLGHVSAKFAQNFPERRFIVIEFDFIKHPPYDALALDQKLDLQSALHEHLRAFASLALVVFSGNASLHGWYPCADAGEDEVREFVEYACRLGADHALFSPCQFTRMPGGTNANGKRQEVAFFAPEEIS